MTQELTDRQKQCLDGVLHRQTAKQIGRELGISHHAVEQHLKAARKKLGASDTLEAVRLYAGATVAPYYGPVELGETSVSSHNHGHPDDAPRSRTVLRDVATEGRGPAYELTPIQTLAAIILASLGLVIILALLIAVAEGVRILAT